MFFFMFCLFFFFKQKTAYDMRISDWSSDVCSSDLLVFYKPDRKAKYGHINSLFTEAINWELIERHYPDMLRVAISIKAGRITPSMILRRLGVASRKNKLYFAFRELGRAIRTKFLLNYINDVELRRVIHQSTNRSEQFNDFAQWLHFANERSEERGVRKECVRSCRFCGSPYH